MRCFRGCLQRRYLILLGAFHISLATIFLRGSKTAFKIDSDRSSYLKQMQTDVPTQGDELINKIDGDCKQKMQDILTSWKSDACFSELGVNGTIESVFQYLKNINVCPNVDSSRNKANLVRNLDDLLLLIRTGRTHKKSENFMVQRILRMWPTWLDGVNTYERWASTSTLSNSGAGQPRVMDRTKLKILIHMGLLTLNPSIGIEENIESGGPLGELVQWTDLIVALYLLGHQVTVSKDLQVTRGLLRTEKYRGTKCNEASSQVDLIYTDIRGCRQINRMNIHVPTCKLRVLDSFGTQAKYNRGSRTEFGGLNLNLQQFYTLFPHSPDNTFLGFVVETTALPEQNDDMRHSKPIALVAGKVAKMWEESKTYLEVLSEYFEIHGNVADGTEKNLPSFVINHKLHYGTDYLRLLRSAKVRILIGLGFPYESPAPLEAIANGIIFLNVRFKPPHGRGSTKFFANKPTDRELTSQHPYVEQYIGEPYSYLIDRNNATQIRQVMKRLLATSVNSGYTTFEFTNTGYLERLNAFLEHQWFCNHSKLVSSSSPVYQLRKSLNVIGSAYSTAGIHLVLAQAGESCSTACDRLSHTQDAVDTNTMSYLHRRTREVQIKGNTSHWFKFHCAPEFFAYLNRTMNSHVFCRRTLSHMSPFAPYYVEDEQICVTQASSPLWFECVSVNASSVIRRLCPCRDSLPGQTAICTKCL
ncbi:Mannoside acetylglucosaminyltransferase 5 [Paragonimus heterotremus]|uniref:alpha-1,6-mannosyl-glycoprotein 6-beta-N-acetylglucosaminyltransferase n=1 Tax=Paragonimus heterotremus TaxID=100268 RepID=A0A8J4T1R9_9TREM|nr:Mannoside acetylglucosaminyltransferase 5 [Paragonimus heterotremus]